MTVLLDTNVLSELRRPEKADPRVRAFAAGAHAAEFYLSVITILEIEQSILMVERKDVTQARILRSWFDGQILPQFAERILAIDNSIALCCARLHVPDPRSERDALIAATALVHGMTAATRNVADFRGTKVRLVDPWDGTP